jgi:hypothetical protein
MPIVPPQHDPPTHNFRLLLVPIGHQEWLLVDSCLDFASRQPALLAYLRSIGVNPSV